MKRLAFFSLLSGLLFVLPHGAQAYTRPIATPSAVLFYPNEAHVTVEERLASEAIPGKGNGLVIALPHAAVTETFSVTLNGKPADSFYWLPQTALLREKVEPGGKVTTEKLLVAVGGTAQQEDKDDAQRRTLRTAVESLRTDIEVKEAALAATEARLKLWNTPLPQKDVTTDDLIKLDTAFAQNLASLHEAKTRNTRLLAELRRSLSEAEKALREYDDNRSRHLAVIPFDNDKSATVRYSYIMPAACSLAYTLNALPEKNIVTIGQQAEVSQASGKTWADVDVFISTSRRDKRLQPQPLQAWVVSLMSKTPPVQPMPAPRAAAKSAMMEAAEPVAMEAAGYAADNAVAVEQGTFRLWNLGKRTIDSGVTVSMPLASDEYKAEFSYTFRPAVNPLGYLTAEITSEKAFELPRGVARYLVDNAMVGVQPLAVNGNKATLFFGTDPLVSATMVDRQRSSGESGFINKEQTMLWDWEITVKNGRNRAVNAVVEDPLPNARNDAIKITAESKPAPEQTVSAEQNGGRKVYSWKLTLGPGETQTITHKVRIAAPADGQLNPGRGRGTGPADNHKKERAFGTLFFMATRILILII